MKRKLVYLLLVVMGLLLIIARGISAAPASDYRWLDVANQQYSSYYMSNYTYEQAQVTLSYPVRDLVFNGTLTATNLKPNFAYQVKLIGEPGTEANERIGLVGRWWQEEWNGTTWVNGQNLNDKGDGSSPNPNDEAYFDRRDMPDPTSPTGLKYKFTGYLVLDYFITDENGEVELAFEADSSYHVLWKTTQRTWTSSDGPVKSTTFDADDAGAYEDSGGDDFPVQIESIYGEWERLPVGGVFLAPGDYQAEFVLTEESFHGSGGTYAGNWAQAISQDVAFTVAERVSEILHLSPGWNLMALPIFPESSFTAQSLLDDINVGQGGSCSEVDRWLNGGWDAHVDGLLINDFAITMGEGYFMKCSTHSDWTVDGMTPSEELMVTLLVGWNLISVPYPPQSYDAQSLLDKFEAEGSICTEVDRWLNGGWDAHIDGLSFNNFSIDPDKGYFVRCISIE